MTPSTLRSSFTAILSISLVVLLSACQSVQYAPITTPPTDQHMPGKFVWHDLITPDVEGAKRFYGELFGWQFETRNGYTLIRNGDRIIGGIVAAGSAKDAGNARWILSLSVADVDKTAERVRQAGGDVLIDAMDLTPRGRFALVSDNRGAQLGLLRSATGDPLDAPPGVGDWLWSELWSNDLKSSLDFYQRVAGYKAEGVSTDVRSAPYRVLSIDGKWRAGIGQIPWDNIHDQWLPYVRVADVTKAAARVEALGGKVYIKSEDPNSANPRALIADPSGAVLMIERWDEPVAPDANGEGAQ